AQGELAPRIAEYRSGGASALGAGGTDYRDDLLVSHESSRISGRRFPAPSVPGVEASESYKGAPVCQKDGFATISITIRISIAVSNRKTMKRRFPRRPTCGESGPYVAASLPIRPNSGPTKAMPTVAAIAHPTIAKLIQNVLQPQLPFSIRATPSP